MTSALLDPRHAFTPLPIDSWEDTKNTLHLFAQVVGKVRMRLFPKLNHWWHVTLYPTPRGLGTGSIPYGYGAIDLEFDFIEHRLRLRASDGGEESFALQGLAVADFYAAVMERLQRLGVHVDIVARPYDVPFSRTAFADDHTHASYDAPRVQNFWRALLGVHGVFEEFRGRFLGKSTPVHLFWHHMDLALTRFSGRPHPLDQGTQADREAYSHEVISFGFWAGDPQVREAAFYSYTYPEPDGLSDAQLRPPPARWISKSGSAMAYLSYDAVRTSDDPRRALLDFLHSAYVAGAERGGWDTQAMKLRD